jgi:hypothetical protein
VATSPRAPTLSLSIDLRARELVVIWAMSHDAAGVTQSSGQLARGLSSAVSRSSIATCFRSSRAQLDGVEAQLSHRHHPGAACADRACHRRVEPMSAFHWHKLPVDASRNGRAPESRPSGDGDFEPFVWSGRASQEGSLIWGSNLARISGLWLERFAAPGHHGYQRALDLISGQASKRAKRVTTV